MMEVVEAKATQGGAKKQKQEKRSRSYRSKRNRRQEVAEVKEGAGRRARKT